MRKLVVPMAEEEYSPIPSGMRRPRVPAPSGPEEAEEPRGPPEVSRPSIPKVSVSVPAISLGGGAPGALVIAIGIIALLALYLAYSANSELGRMKAEAKGLAADLKKFRDREVSIAAPLEGKVTVRKDVPLAGVFPAFLRASGTLILAVKATLIGRSSTGAIFEVPIDQNVSIDFTAPLDFSKTGEGQDIRIDEEIPLGNEAVLKVTARDVWGEDLNSVVRRLEEISR